MAKNWIAGAIKKPGSLTKQAKAAGKSLSDFCSGGDLSPRTKKRCALRKTLISFHGKGGPGCDGEGGCGKK